MMNSKALPKKIGMYWPIIFYSQTFTVWRCSKTWTVFNRDMLGEWSDAKAPGSFTRKDLLAAYVPLVIIGWWQCWTSWPIREEPLQNAGIMIALIPVWITHGYIVRYWKRGADGNNYDNDNVMNRWLWSLLAVRTAICCQILPTCSTGTPGADQFVQVWAAINAAVGRVMPDYTTAVDRWFREDIFAVEPGRRAMGEHFQRLTKHTDVILEKSYEVMHVELECSSIRSVGCMSEAGRHPAELSE